MVWSGAQKNGTFCITEVFQASPVNCLRMNTTPAAEDYYELLEITRDYCKIGFPCDPCKPTVGAVHSAIGI